MIYSWLEHVGIQFSQHWINIFPTIFPKINIEETVPLQGLLSSPLSRTRRMQMCKDIAVFLYINISRTGFMCSIGAVPGTNCASFIGLLPLPVSLHPFPLCSISTDLIFMLCRVTALTWHCFYSVPLVYVLILMPASCYFDYSSPVAFLEM